MPNTASASSSENSPERPLHPYYSTLQNPTITHSMKDLDFGPNIDTFNRLLLSSKSRNFVIDFSDDEAYAGFDLDAESLGELLNKPRPAELNTRWINLWCPVAQRDILEVVARFYDFTPRLLGFMCSPTVEGGDSERSSTGSSSRSSFFHRGGRNGRNGPNGSSSNNSTLEERIGMQNLESSQIDIVAAMNPYKFATEIWHYSTVDWGRRYVCLGYNALHNVPHHHQHNPPNSTAEDLLRDRPSGKRTWTWLLLLEDKTVLSIQEDPYPSSSHNNILTHQQQISLGIIRRNLVNVFRQCSKARHSPDEPPQIKLPLRMRLGDTEEESMHRPTDLPGLLFYYLFDDWFNTYGLIGRREHRYARELDRLRQEMLTSAQLSHVDNLHHIGRQLSTLKRLYQGYDSIIARLLEKQESTLASLKNSHILASTTANSPHINSMSSSQIHDPTTNGAEIIGVSFSSAARVRFERLRHRINLYVLSEINGCLEQKESLVMMNFNLIAIKESYSVERLTRVTLLLAKVTLIFMPVSLMTAYFSAQFKDVEFAVGTYWKWFGGTVGASIAGLMLFSFASGTVEGGIVYRPLGRRVTEICDGLFGRRGRSGGQDMRLDEG
ncbi:hypothetical protein EJ08DRAFT_591732 [Tothia fuscella]|uniref:ADP-ribosylation factor n=1 Tax=Tothia fuscella TaxID=1048955 RepID=A0A9P4TW62_9PEZI|nr:hypothetical protein EJ08DRAFT_591732 [Tothia fuscella]